MKANSSSQGNADLMIIDESVGTSPKVDNINQKNIRSQPTGTNSVNPLDSRHNADEIGILLKNKADMSDLQHLVDIKANKHDAENTMRNVDILHKQVTHIIVLLIEFLKTMVH